MSDEEIQEVITYLLERKQEIDALESGQFIERQRWLVESVELLLKLNQKEPPK